MDLMILDASFAPLGVVMLLVGFTLYVAKGKPNWVYQVCKKINQN